MADVITTDTHLGATKEALIAAVVQKELAGSTAVIPYTDYSFLVSKGMKSVAVPRFGSFTPVDRVGGAAGDATALTGAVDTINLDINAYVSWIIDSYDEVLSKVDVQLEFARRAAAAHARFFDGKLIAELESAGDATATAGALSYSIFVEMKETLLSQYANPANLVFVGGPGAWAAMMGIAEFKNSYQYGQPVIPSGVVGSPLGVQVIIDSNITSATTYYMYDKEALGVAFAQGASYSEQGANTYGSKAMRAVLDQIYGVKGLQVGVAGATGSAGIIKDAN